MDLMEKAMKTSYKRDSPKNHFDIIKTCAKDFLKLAHDVIKRDQHDQHLSQSQNTDCESKNIESTVPEGDIDIMDFVKKKKRKEYLEVGDYIQFPDPVFPDVYITTKIISFEQDKGCPLVLENDSVLTMDTPIKKLGKTGRSSKSSCYRLIREYSFAGNNMGKNALGKKEASKTKAKGKAPIKSNKQKPAKVQNRKVISKINNIQNNKRKQQLKRSKGKGGK